MKVTKRQLRRIIKEEKRKLLRENDCKRAIELVQSMQFHYDEPFSADSNRVYDRLQDIIDELSDYAGDDEGEGGSDLPLPSATQRDVWKRQGSGR